MKKGERRKTTEARWELAFDAYKRLLRKEFEENPERAKSVSKSYLYIKVGKEVGFDPDYVGFIVQTKLKELGIDRKRTRNLYMEGYYMDEEVRRVLELPD